MSDIITPPTKLVELTRRPDWAAQLSLYVGTAQRESWTLDWENYNCMSWALGAIKAMTDVDLYAQILPMGVKSPATAWRAIQEQGYQRMSDIARDHFEIRSPRTLRGDLVLVPVSNDGTPISWDGPRLGGQGTDQNLPDAPNWLDLGMDCAWYIADGPVSWGLGEYGIETVPFSPEYLSFSVGRFEDVLCLQQ